MNAEQLTHLRKQIWEYADQHTEHAILHIEDALRIGVTKGTVKQAPCQFCQSPGPTVTPEFYQTVNEITGGHPCCRDWKKDITQDTTEGAITRIGDWEQWEEQQAEDSDEEIYDENR